MQNTSVKQFVIQLLIQIVASAIVSYITYKILQNAANKGTKQTKSNQTVPPPAVVVTPQPVVEETV